MIVAHMPTIVGNYCYLENESISNMAADSVNLWRGAYGNYW